MFFSRCDGPFNRDNITVESVEIKCDICHESYVMKYDKLNVGSTEGVVTAMLPCGHTTVFIHEIFMEPKLREAFREARMTEAQRKTVQAKKQERLNQIDRARKQALSEHLERQKKCCKTCYNLRFIRTSDNEDCGYVDAPVCSCDFPKILNMGYNIDDPYETDVNIERPDCKNYMFVYRCYNCGCVIGDEPSKWGFAPRHPDYNFEMDVEYICEACRELLPNNQHKGMVVPLSIYVEDEFNDDYDDSLDYE